MARDPDGLWRWLDDLVRCGDGAVELGLTEDGDVGVWLFGDDTAAATGDTAHEALTMARENEKAGRWRRS